MKYKKGTFLITPNKELLRGIPPSELAIYVWLCSYADEKLECFPSMERLKKDVKLGKTSVQRSILSLKNRGLIKIIKSGGPRTSNLYRILVKDGNSTVPQRNNEETYTVPGRNSLRSSSGTQRSREHHLTKSIEVNPVELNSVLLRNTGASRPLGTAVPDPQKEKNIEDEESKSCDFFHDANPLSSETTEEEPSQKKADAKLIGEGIALFEKVFPMEFMIDGKSPYAIFPTRNMVAGALATRGLPRLKEITEEFVEHRSQKYCPNPKNIWAFCANLDRIEAFLEKEKKDAPYKPTAQDVEPSEVERIDMMGVLHHDMKTPLLDAVTRDAIVEYAKYGSTKHSFENMRRLIYLLAIRYLRDMKLFADIPGGYPAPEDIRDLYMKAIKSELATRLVNGKGNPYSTEWPERDLWDTSIFDL